MLLVNDTPFHVAKNKKYRYFNILLRIIYVYETSERITGGVFTVISMLPVRNGCRPLSRDTIQPNYASGYRFYSETLRYLFKHFRLLLLLKGETNKK